MSTHRIGNIYLYTMAYELLGPLHNKLDVLELCVCGYVRALHMYNNCLYAPGKFKLIEEGTYLYTVFNDLTRSTEICINRGDPACLLTCMIGDVQLLYSYAQIEEFIRESYERDRLTTETS